jgi:RNA polymerase subunit RPABC4/transcription elongation factor Spt4
MRIPIELPAIEDLPQAICRICGKSKIMGLFTPSELLSHGGPRCRVCTNEISETWRGIQRKGKTR